MSAEPISPRTARGDETIAGQRGGAPIPAATARALAAGGAFSPFLPGNVAPFHLNKAIEEFRRLAKKASRGIAERGEASDSDAALWNVLAAIAENDSWGAGRTGANAFRKIGADDRQAIYALLEARCTGKVPDDTYLTILGNF